MTVMLQNGLLLNLSSNYSHFFISYLNLGPQLMPIKSKRSLTLKRIKKGIGLAFLSNVSEDTRQTVAVGFSAVVKTYHVGVVDEKLRVRTFTIETPNMWRRAYQYLFCYDDVDHDDWRETISQLIVNQVQPALNLGRIVNKTHSQEHQNGFKISVDESHKRFDQNGKLVKNAFDVQMFEKTHEVKLAVSADRMITTEYYFQGKRSQVASHLMISWNILQAKCVPRHLDKPLFLAADYDE